MNVSNFTLCDNCTQVHNWVSIFSYDFETETMVIISLVSISFEQVGASYFSVSVSYFYGSAHVVPWLFGTT